MPTYTRRMASHCKVTIDGTDVSNSFRRFKRISENALEPAGGFNTTGVAETLPGERTQGFEGDAWYTEELALIVGPIHDNRSTCVITMQPYGLIDATREIFTATCYITTFEPEEEFGSVSTFPFQATVATAAGITTSDWT